MPDISPGTGFKLIGARNANSNRVLAATVAIGQSVSVDADGALVLASASDQVLAGQLGVGIAIEAGTGGQFPLVAYTGCEIDFGTPAPLLAGQFYVVSPNAAGGIAPVTDLGSTHWPTLLGWARTTQILVTQILITNVQRA